MKPTMFTKEERILLQELLKKRLKNYHDSLKREISDKTSRKRFEHFYIKPCASALDKISNYETAFYANREYTNREKLACTSCINEHYEDFYNELQLPTAISWLTVSDEQINIIRKLDNCKDILFKCGYYKKKKRYMWYNPESNYGSILKTVEKLKNCDKIFLSRAREIDYYKITFVYDNQEYATFELKQPVSYRDFKFISLDGKSPDEIGRKRFSLVTNKHEAKELLATCESRYYPEGVLDFIGILLN